MLSRCFSRLERSSDGTLSSSAVSQILERIQTEGSVLSLWRSVAAGSLPLAWSTPLSLMLDSAWVRSSPAKQGQVLMLSTVAQLSQLASLEHANSTPIFKEMNEVIRRIVASTNNVRGQKADTFKPRLAIVAAESLAMLGSGRVKQDGSPSIDMREIDCVAIACAHAVARGEEEDEISRIAPKIKGDIVAFLTANYRTLLAKNTLRNQLDGGTSTELVMSVAHNVDTFNILREQLSLEMKSDDNEPFYPEVRALRLLGQHLSRHPQLSVSPMIVTSVDDPSTLLESILDPAHRQRIVAPFEANVAFLISRGLLRDAAGFISKSLLSADSSQAQRNFELFIEAVGSVVPSTTSPATNPPTDMTIQFQWAPNKPRPFDESAQRDFLVSLAPRNAFWSELVKQGHVALTTNVDETTTFGSARISFPRQHKCLEAGCQKPPVVSCERTAICKVYEDDDILVLNKPPGLPVMAHLLAHQESSPCNGDVVSWVLEHLPALVDVPQSGIVHRIDKGTSGLLVVAKNENARSVLKTQFSKSEHEKRYIAFCQVRVKPEELSSSGVIEEDLEESSRGNSHKRSYAIQTSYRVLRHHARQRIAVVEATITQGKRHQVRRHLQSLGLPLLGDVRYGGSGAAHPLFKDAALHAQQITFRHPRTNEPFEICCSLPFGMRKALAFWGHLERLGKRSEKLTSGKPHNASGMAVAKTGNGGTNAGRSSR